MTDERHTPGHPSPDLPERRSTDRGMGGRVRAIEDQLVRGAARMTSIEGDLRSNTTALEANTIATAEILAIVGKAKGFFSVLGYVGTGVKWLSVTAASCIALYTAWKSS